MKTQFKPLLLAAALATGALGALGATSVIAQDAAPAQARTAQKEKAEGRSWMRVHVHGRHMDDLKSALKLKPAQESKWNEFAAALSPKERVRMDGTKREDFARLSTPERLDKMRELRQQREQDSARRDEATRQFYASLTPEQQKTFDEETLRPMMRAGGTGRPDGEHRMFRREH